MPIEVEKVKNEGSDKPMRTVEMRQSATPSVIYSNSAAVALGFFDVRIFFGETVESTPEKLVVESSVTVIMSPEHAKILSTVLANNVEQYENHFGKIRELPE